MSEVCCASLRKKLQPAKEGAETIHNSTWKTKLRYLESTLEFRTRETCKVRSTFQETQLTNEPFRERLSDRVKLRNQELPQRLLGGLSDEPFDQKQVYGGRVVLGFLGRRRHDVGAPGKVDADVLAVRTGVLSLLKRARASILEV